MAMTRIQTLNHVGYSGAGMDLSHVGYSDAGMDLSHVCYSGAGMDLSHVGYSGAGMDLSTDNGSLQRTINDYSKQMIALRII